MNGLSPACASERVGAANAGGSIDGVSFIVFSDDWGGHPSSCQHLFRRIAKRHDVLWVNTVGMRRPTLDWTDAKKAWRKALRMFRASTDDSAARSNDLRLHVVQPLMLPFNNGALRRFNLRSVISTVARRSSELGIARPILVSTVPNAADYAGHLGERRVVYYCVDDFSQWPGFDHDLVRDMEAQLVSRADVIIATSRKLHRTLRASGKEIRLLTHGVDLAHFGRAADRIHRALIRIPRPRAGYFGLIDRRSDLPLVAETAARMRDVSFVLAGPVETDVAALTRLPNVHFTGALPYAELPELVHGLDVLFLPYLVNDFTASISPLKLKEYLATGRPVIATPMAEAVSARDHLQIASTPEEWSAAIRAALTADIAERRRKMIDLLQDESWERKASEFVRICLGGRESTGSDASLSLIE